MKNEFFKVLTNKELRTFRQWARAHYTPGDEIKTVWHPVVRAECEAMNLEETQKKGA